MKIGFIGCGNMAGAIIDGLIAHEVIAPEDINIYDIYAPATARMQEKYGVNVLDSARAIIKESAIAVLGVKPNVLGEVLDTINTALEESNTLIISIAAGKTIAFIRNHLSHDNRIIRVMPNINAKVGEAICAYTANNKATDEDKERCEQIFSGIGQVMYLDESFFPLFGVLGGCSPAFTYLYIDALARSGVKNGMKKETALMIAAQAVLGSAKMVLESLPQDHPWELIDRVCSPGGTTIEGITSLQQDGFESAVHRAVDKALDKDKKI